MPCSEDLTLFPAFGDAAVTQQEVKKRRGLRASVNNQESLLFRSHGIPGQAQFPAFLARLSAVTGRLPAAPGSLPVLLAAQQTERLRQTQQRAPTGVARTGGSHPGPVGRHGGGYLAGGPGLRAHQPLRSVN